MGKVISLFPSKANGQEKKLEQNKERLKQRKDGYYQVEHRYTDQTGKERKKSFYGKTQKEAIAKRRAFIRELEAGKNIELSEIRAGAYAEDWLRIYKATFARRRSIV